MPAQTRKRAAESSGGSNGAHEIEKQASLKRQKLGDRTDYSRWRLQDKNSDHTWIYVEDDEEAKAWPQSKAEKWYLGEDVVSWLSKLPRGQHANDALRLIGCTDAAEARKPSRRHT
jgi:hypothetical protein